MSDPESRNEALLMLIAEQGAEVESITSDEITEIVNSIT